jgi:hypothetical protein
MMVKIALFVVTMVKVARLGSGAPYAGNGRIKTVLGQIHLMFICVIFVITTFFNSNSNSNWFWGNQARRGLNTPDPGVMRPSVRLSYFHYKSQNFKNCPYLWIQVDKKYVKV